MELEDLAIRTGSDEKAIEEYMRMQKWLGGEVELEKEVLYCQMFNPLHFVVDTFSEETKIESYKKAILDLIKHPRIFSVSVNNNRTWRRVQKLQSEYTIFDQLPKKRSVITYFRNIERIDNDNNIREMARIAVNDRDHYNYMEVIIRSKGPTKERPLIEFGQYEIDEKTRVIGYEISFPFRHSHLFNLRTDREEYGRVRALWVPEDYIELPSPASMRKGGR